MNVPRFVPAEALGETGGGVRGGGDGGLGGPIAVRRVPGRRSRRRRGVNGVLRREGSELGAEPGDLAEVGGMDEVPLSLSPLGPPILEPNLQNSDMIAFVEMISARIRFLRSVYCLVCHSLHSFLRAYRFNSLRVGIFPLRLVKQKPPSSLRLSM